MKYAGIGPRDAPGVIRDQMTAIGIMLQEAGFILRSGDGIGSDQAWAEEVPDWRTEIFIVSQKPNCSHGIIPNFTQEQWDFANKHFGMHRTGSGKVPLNLLTQSEYVQALFCRNLNILLGEDLQQPVDFVAYWWKEDKPHGWASGTGHTVSMANELGIPCFNIGIPEQQDAMQVLVNKLIDEQLINSMGVE